MCYLKLGMSGADFTLAPMVYALCYFYSFAFFSFPGHEKRAGVFC